MGSPWPKTNASGLGYLSSFAVVLAIIVLAVPVYTRLLVGSGESATLSRLWSYLPESIGLGILEVCTEECLVWTYVLSAML